MHVSANACVFVYLHMCADVYESVWFSRILKQIRFVDKVFKMFLGFY